MQSSAHKELKFEDITNDGFLSRTVFEYIDCKSSFKDKLKLRLVCRKWKTIFEEEEKWFPYRKELCDCISTSAQIVNKQYLNGLIKYTNDEKLDWRKSAPLKTCYIHILCNMIVCKRIIRDRRKELNQLSFQKVFPLMTFIQINQKCKELENELTILEHRLKQIRTNIVYKLLDLKYLIIVNPIYISLNNQLNASGNLKQKDGTICSKRKLPPYFHLSTDNEEEEEKERGGEGEGVVKRKGKNGNEEENESYPNRWDRVPKKKRSHFV
jgi:hypothetical protein